MIFSLTAPRKLFARASRIYKSQSQSINIKCIGISIGEAGGGGSDEFTELSAILPKIPTAIFDFLTSTNKLNTEIYRFISK